MTIGTTTASTKGHATTPPCWLAGLQHAEHSNPLVNVNQYRRNANQATQSPHTTEQSGPDMSQLDQRLLFLLLCLLFLLLCLCLLPPLLLLFFFFLSLPDEPPSLWLLDESLRFCSKGEGETNKTNGRSRWMSPQVNQQADEEKKYLCF